MAVSIGRGPNSIERARNAVATFFAAFTKRILSLRLSEGSLTLWES